ncbi:hypothetical protein FACUT_13204 [Fusarium acutatum]|uniref:Uncharacterized protein n=1 Tax=Fusarium acutatum TaxID=78861 RepID=A0A8H4JAK8_9HYPO|nr:hypothetical protein FACUT_13204 [Fusarium acutatum]
MSLTESKNKSQKVGLLDLPSELLFSIIEDEDMCWRDHISIHHVSSRLFQLTFKHVYDGKRDIFQHACSSANLGLMIECVKHSDVPTGRLWHDPGDLFYDTPLDLLSSARGLYTCEWTKLNELVRILFDDLFAPWIYKGDSPSYFSDTFEAKIKLLIKYEGVDGNEQSALENILDALRSIEARQRDNGGLNFEGDGTWCWHELCVSICHNASIQDHSILLQYSREDPPRQIRLEVERCVHEFVRTKAWYPPKDLLRI